MPYADENATGMQRYCSEMVAALLRTGLEAKLLVGELQGEPDWLKSKDGTVWHLADGSVAGTKRAAWQAWFIWYAALAALAPNQVGAIINAADDAATTP